MTAMNLLRASATLLIGVPALVGGCLFVALEVGAGNGVTAYLWFFMVLTAGGAALLATLWRPLWLGPLQVGMIGAAGLAGTAAGLAAQTYDACCMFAYHQARGLPFTWVGRGFESPDYIPPEQAMAHLDAAGIAWRVQSTPHAIANVLFWAAVALILVVAVRLGQAARRAYAGDRDLPDAEPRAELRPVDA
jgi:hypothetical protein